MIALCHVTCPNLEEAAEDTIKPNVKPRVSRLLKE